MRVDGLRLEGTSERYLLQFEKCPQSAADLTAANLARADDVKDPWGEDYVIECTDTPLHVTVRSNGPDRRPGGGDDMTRDSPRE